MPGVQSVSRIERRSEGPSTLEVETFTIPELLPGTRAYTYVSGALVEVEVIYVRPPRVGRHRVMLRRTDNRKILYHPRVVSALYRSRVTHPGIAKAKR